MRISEIVAMAPTDKLIHRLLFEGLNYDGSAADLIMVLGSKKACDYRVPEAVRLLAEGKAPRVLLCGGKVQQTSLGKLPECEAMQRAALELGVSQEVLLIERRSMTTEENFRFGKDLIAKELPGCKRIVLVTTAYHMRRALLMARKLLPQYEFVPCPVQKGSATKENWHTTEKGRQTVLDEWGKFGYYIREGLMDDEEV